VTINTLIAELRAGLEGTTPDHLRNVVSYDPETGILRWSIDIRAGRYGNRVNAKAGDAITSLDTQGYITFKFAKRPYRAHRVAYFLCHGVLPKVIDHINGNRSDNRIANLRSADCAQNGWNRGKQKNNSSGYKGVRMGTHGRWMATIWANRKPRHLGYFDTPEAASEAYKRAAQELHGSFARTE